jgi:hypothetical protein
MTLKRLYVKCLNCDLIFPSGFQAESVTQLIGFSYLCPKCRRIFPCPPSEYFEKINEKFQKAIKEEEMFALPFGNRIEISGPDVFDLNEEVLAKPGAFLSSDKAIISYKPKE